MKAAEIVTLYDGLINKAYDILSKARGYACWRDENALLVLENGNAVLLTAEATTEYDSAVLNWERECFPAWLLDATDAEIDKWAEEQKEARRKAQEEYNRQRSEQIAAQERAVYLALKAKYEG